ncbi:hypothetical protein JG688_00001795 [Phytophthora aleatoria]|uniref:Uncharacterized protein n=1 Tax=Phytophthora aleatoria TaxID=2496075 RepID=A0A8J5MD42_9STRA|nr:hypothetical protein JG688_00001795 [Phytophthora aleatoria]
MNELTPSHPAPHPPPVSSQSRGLATPYAAFSVAGAMNANIVNLAAVDRAKSFQGVPRGGVNLGNAKYQSPHPQQLQQVNEFHAGPYTPANYAHLKSPADNRPVNSNGGKFDYAPPPSQQYSQHPTQQQSYVAPYGYPSYSQNYGNTGNYQQQQQQQQQPTQQQQQYHGGYGQGGETNPLGMLVTSATNPQASDAMPHEPVNIGLKDGGDRKFRQPFNVVPNDSFLSSSGGYLHGVERTGNVVQIKTTPGNTQQQPMYQRSNMYGGTAYFSQQQQVQQRTQEPTQQHNPLDLVPPSAAMSASFDANGNGGASSSMGRGMNSGGMYNTGSRMPQFSPSGSGPSLTTRLKDGGVDISTGSSNGSHLPFMQQQQPTAKSLELTHPTSLYADVTSSTTSMAMASNTITSLPHATSAVSYGLGGENVTMSQSSTGQGEMPLNSGGPMSNNTGNSVATVVGVAAGLLVAALVIKEVASVSVMVVGSAASMMDAITRLSLVDCANCTAEVAAARFLTARRVRKVADCAVLTAVKCIIPECSKTGRIDNLCTKHYFERHPAQPPGTVSTTPPPVITVNANTSAARARAERKRAAEQQAAAANYASMSSVMLAGPVPPFDERVGGAMTKTEPF